MRKKTKNKTYRKLIRLKQRKKLSKKKSKKLDKLLNQKYCKCVKKLKYGKNGLKKGSEYPICMSSIYNKRGFKPPKNVIRTCKKKK